MSLLLRLCERFGMDGNKSDVERTNELKYRAERDAELRREFPRIVASGWDFEHVIGEIHRILNSEKRFRNYHRVMKLFYPKGYTAGAYRETQQRGADYLAPRPSDVPALMRAFGQRLDRLMAGPIDDAQTRLVCGWALAMMIRIHAFADGNGRTARTLINGLLARARHATIEFTTDSFLYRQSPVWSGLKRHMSGVRAELGWSLKAGSVPPSDYYNRLRDSLAEEITTASTASLALRPDFRAIADALEAVRQEGFDAYRSCASLQ